MIPSPLQYEFWEILIELGVIWIGVYLMFRFLQGTRGAGVIRGLGFLGVMLILLYWLVTKTESFNRLDVIFTRFLEILAFLLIVIFQPELRQAAIRIGQTKFLRGSQRNQETTINAIAEAAEFLSKNQFGAIIAIERNVQLGGLVDGGQHLDAAISARLLQSVFWPSSPLHDLGVVVRDNRILAAGVQFPLAEEGSLPANFGSRHRAALGLATESDCVVVIVSEETGRMSIAVDGHFEMKLTPEQFTDRLRELLDERPVEVGLETEPLIASADVDDASEPAASTIEPESSS
ncbi:MAG: diadenylate cyclase CdaA [Phycisphaerales bacterium]|nr:diadenylate cyclase CdaA [Phycisphaerales bacterium]